MLYIIWLYISGVIKLDKFVIKGNTKLNGEVEISGAKNAAVAIYQQLY